MSVGDGVSSWWADDGALPGGPQRVRALWNRGTGWWKAPWASRSAALARRVIGGLGAQGSRGQPLYGECDKGCLQLARFGSRELNRQTRMGDRFGGGSNVRRSPLRRAVRRQSHRYLGPTSRQRRIGAVEAASCRRAQPSAGSGGGESVETVGTAQARRPTASGQAGAR